MNNKVRPTRMPWLLAICMVTIAFVASKHFRSSTEEGSTIQRPQPFSSATVVLQETVISAGRSATTPDGAFTIRVDRVSERTARLAVLTKNGDVYTFDKAEAGRRLVVPAPDGTYDLDLLRVSGNVVHVSMSRR